MLVQGRFCLGVINTATHRALEPLLWGRLSSPVIQVRPTRPIRCMLSILAGHDPYRRPMVERRWRPHSAQPPRFLYRPPIVVRRWSRAAADCTRRDL